MLSECRADQARGMAPERKQRTQLAWVPAERVGCTACLASHLHKPCHEWSPCTRLETRTKESTAYASVGVIQTRAIVPITQSESEGSRWVAGL